MRSIRLRRRPDVASASPGSDSDPADGPASTEIDIPRALLPADHRHRVERPALLAAAPERGAPTLLRRPGRRAGARRRRRGGHRSLRGLRAGGRRSDQWAVQRPTIYEERLADRGLKIEPGVHPFLHWLSVGWDERVVPTVLFDEEFYVARHPDVASGPDWAFAQYLRAGCYAPGRSPTPFGPNYGGVPAPDARERQDPPLVTGLLHRAADYDLTRTSWLEQGVTLGAAKLAALDTERMRGLVAKAAAIEPLIAADAARAVGQLAAPHASDADADRACRGGTPHARAGARRHGGRRTRRRRRGRARGRGGRRCEHWSPTRPSWSRPPTTRRSRPRRLDGAARPRRPVVRLHGGPSAARACSTWCAAFVRGGWSSPAAPWAGGCCRRTARRCGTRCRSPPYSPHRQGPARTTRTAVTSRAASTGSTGWSPTPTRTATTWPRATCCRPHARARVLSAGRLRGRWRSPSVAGERRA